MIEFFLPACVCECLFPFYSKAAQYEQDLKHLHYELRSKEIFLTKVKFCNHLGKFLNLKKNSKLLVTI
jgi:hypothetical protein